MAYLVGAGLAWAVSLFASLVGLDRDRAFYPTVTIVIASYYALFAVMAGSSAELGRECVVMSGFAVASVLGFKRNLWILVAGLCAHGVFDLGHAQLITNPGVPSFWPAFCLSYDVTAGGYLAWRLLRSRIAAVPS
jgi:hypothetical protein